MKPGDYTGDIKNIEFITSGRQYVRPLATTFNVTVERGTASMIGDANDDGIINMMDVITVINYILGKSPSPFNYVNADANQDTMISMTDVTKIINIILGK